MANLGNDHGVISKEDISLVRGLLGKPKEKP